MIFFMLNRRAHPGLFGFSPPFFNPVFLSCLIAQYFPDLVFDLSKRNTAAVGKLRVLLVIWHSIASSPSRMEITRAGRRFD